MILVIHMVVKKKGARKSNILSCSNNEVVAKTSVKVSDGTIRKGAHGTIVKQRRTPQGYARATIDFKDKGTHEVPTSKLKCA